MKKYVTLFLVSLFLMVGSKPVFAIGNADISLEFPKNQSPNVTSYYDLNVNPGEVINLNLFLKNNSNNPQNFYIRPANAFTSSSGSEIVLSEETSFPQSKVLTKKNLISTWISTPKSILLKPLESKEITLKVTVPNNVSGQYLGGFLVSDDNTTSSLVKKSDINIRLNQRFQRGIAILLNVGKIPSDNVVLQSADFKQVNNKKIIELNIKNPISKISYLYDPNIVLKENDKIIGKFQIERLKFSPQSSIVYSYDISKYDFQYNNNIKVELEGYYDQNQNKKMFNNTVQLKADTKPHNDNSHSLKSFFKQEHNVSTSLIQNYKFLAYAIIAFLLVTILLFIWNKKKHKKQKHK